MYPTRSKRASWSNALVTIFAVVLLSCGKGTSPSTEHRETTIDTGKPSACTDEQKNRSPFAGGSGTESDPFQICSLTQLKNVLTNPSKSYLLLNSLDFRESDSFHLGSFSGTFDGNGYTLAYFSADMVYTGLFPFLQPNGVIRNLSIVDANAKGRVVGILVGWCYGKISNIRTSGTVTGTEGGGTNDLGGIVGRALQGCLVEDTSSTATISGNGSLGGLAGFADAGFNIRRSHFSGKVQAIGVQSNALDGAGGLAGFVAGIGQIEDSFSTGIVNGHSVAGGIVGRLYHSNSTVTQTYSSGNVSVQAPNPIVAPENGVGGLVGVVSMGTVSKSFSTGMVTGFPSGNTSGAFGYHPALHGQASLGPTSDIYWDVSRSGVSTCSANSTAIPGCLGINAGNTQPLYFYSRTSSPLSFWDFGSLWIEVPNSYPVFR